MRDGRCAAGSEMRRVCGVGCRASGLNKFERGGPTVSYLHQLVLYTR